jgi:hypothetical protein
MSTLTRASDGDAGISTPGRGRGSHRRPPLPVPESLADVPAEVAEYAARFTPTSMALSRWLELRFAVLLLLAMAGIEKVNEARKFLFIMGAYLDAVAGPGVVVPDGERLRRWCTYELVETQIAAWTSEGTVGASRWGTRSMGTVASLARWAARMVNPRGGWPAPPERHSRNYLRPPYTDDEVAMIMVALRELPDTERALNLRVTVAACLGAGARPGEILRAEGHQIHQREDGRVIFSLPSPDGVIDLPVPLRFAMILLHRARAAGDTGRLLTISTRENSLSELLATNLGSDVPRLSARRLRTTWMVDRIRAGLQPYELKTWSRNATAGFLADVLAYCPRQDDHVARHALFTDVTQRVPS